MFIGGNEWEWCDFSCSITNLEKAAAKQVSAQNWGQICCSFSVKASRQISNSPSFILWVKQRQNKQREKAWTLTWDLGSCLRCHICCREAGAHLSQLPSRNIYNTTAHCKRKFYLFILESSFGLELPHPWLVTLGTCVSGFLVAQWIRCK